MKITWKSCLRLGITVVLVYLFIHFFPTGIMGLILTTAKAILPLVVGCILAYILNILMVFFERHFFPVTKKNWIKKLRRPVCVVLALVSLVAIIVLIVSLILPELIECINLVIAIIPGAINRSAEFLQKHGLATEKVVNELTKINWDQRIEEIISMTFSYFGNVVNVITTILSTVFSGVISALLSVIFAIYLLLSKDRLLYQFNRLLDCYTNEGVQHRSRFVCRVLNESFHNYIVGQCTEAVILGILCTIGMMILSLPYATMIGALVAFTALIPIVGAYFGAIVGAFMILMVDPLQALIFLIFLVILQQFEGNIIYPRVVGTSVGLPAIWVQCQAPHRLP